MLRYFILLLCIAFILSSCGSESDTETAAEPLMLQLVNAARAVPRDCGDEHMVAVGPLTWNDTLQKAARGHAEDMHLNQYFAHEGLNGSTPATRVTDAGYRYQTTGENIAAGYKSEEEVMQGWLDSPGHCVNIMRPEFKELGADRVGDHWVQSFGTQFPKFVPGT